MKVDVLQPQKLFSSQLICDTRDGPPKKFPMKRGVIIYSGLLIGHGRKSQISLDFQGQICEKISRFRGSFRGKLNQKAIGKIQLFLWLFSRQISLEICADQTSICILTVFVLSTTMRSRNEPMAKPLTSWLVGSFSQHNLHLVVSGCCLHVSVTEVPR